MNEPKLIKGGLAVDDRGELCYNNDFDMSLIKRYYMVSNHKSHFIRAWHAHKKEAKFVTVVKGTALIGAVKIDNWDKPNPDTKINKFILSEKNPAVLYIPAGYANGFMNLTKDTKIMFFSTSTLEESKGDDYRFYSRYWDYWSIKER